MSGALITPGAWKPGSSEGLLPAGPGARGAFCYPGAAGAESRPRPAVSLPVHPRCRRGQRALLAGTAGVTLPCCWKKKSGHGPILQGLHLLLFLPSGPGCLQEGAGRGEGPGVPVEAYCSDPVRGVLVTASPRSTEGPRLPEGLPFLLVTGMIW